VDRRAEREGKGGVKGLSSRAEVREKARGEYGFSSLMKQNKKAEICFVIYIAGFFFKKKFCYEVIVKQKIYKRSSNYYWLDTDEGRGSSEGYIRSISSSPYALSIRFSRLERVCCLLVLNSVTSTPQWIRVRWAEASVFDPEGI